MSNNTRAMIYLKENDRKDAQRLLCMFHATDYEYEVLGETTNLEEVKDCDVLLIASASVLTRDRMEYEKIKRELKEKGIKIEVSGENDRVGNYLEMMLQMSHKGRK